MTWVEKISYNLRCHWSINDWGNCTVLSLISLLDFGSSPSGWIFPLLRRFCDCCHVGRRIHKHLSCEHRQATEEPCLLSSCLKGGVDGKMSVIEELDLPKKRFLWRRRRHRFCFTAPAVLKDVRSCDHQVVWNKPVNIIITSEDHRASRSLFQDEEKPFFKRKKKAGLKPWIKTQLLWEKSFCFLF